MLQFVKNANKIGALICSLVNHLNELESQLIYLERCQRYRELEPEEGYLEYGSERKGYIYQKQKNLKKILQKDDTQEKIIQKGAIEFSDVSAAYPTKFGNVIENMSFTVEPGQKVGIVGRSGAGKSSLIKLLWRVLEPFQGKILVDGQDISQFDLKRYRSEISIISQETTIFQGTLRENIDPNHHNCEDKTSEIYTKRETLINTYLRELGFANDGYLKDGLSMKVETENSGLSEGEAQVIAFVREIVSPKKLAIFDEATSNLDLEVELMFQKKLNLVFQESTVFIIAHKLSNVMDCDKVMVLSHGVIAEFGEPEKLLADNSSWFY